MGRESPVFRGPLYHFKGTPFCFLLSSLIYVGNECRGGSVGPYFTCSSIKFEVANDKSLKRRNIHGAHIKSFKGHTGKFPSPRGPPSPCAHLMEWPRNRENYIK